MEFSEQEKAIHSFLEAFDRGQLIDKKNDPLVLITKVSNLCYKVSSFSIIFSEGNVVHNESLPQDLLSYALLLTSNAIGALPSIRPIREKFGSVQTWYDEKSGTVIYVAVTGVNTDDCVLISQGIASLLYSLKK